MHPQQPQHPQYPQQYGQQPQYPQQYGQQPQYPQQYGQQPQYPQQYGQQPGYPPHAQPPAHPQYVPQPYGPASPEPPPYLSASASTEARQALVDRGKRDITFGAIWLAVGIGITVCSFAYFSGLAGIIAWGPAVYGIYKIIKGVITVNRHS